MSKAKDTRKVASVAAGENEGLCTVVWLSDRDHIFTGESEGCEEPFERDGTTRNANRSTTSRDPVQVPIGPITRARAKKFKNELNDLIQELSGLVILGENRINSPKSWEEIARVENSDAPEEPPRDPMSGRAAIEIPGGFPLVLAGFGHEVGCAGMRGELGRFEPPELKGRAAAAAVSHGCWD
ncbi:hypothetical protein CRG98_040768 [Punica granatum]|uniref:Uncharacterized protein n=1 Tax=Punica granatum TaxID=22663 RepID=A0A2I0I595_PUNGR|nr:hypothetical protein CRG98_040768 [Punica granatum]